MEKSKNIERMEAYIKKMNELLEKQKKNKK